jgi:hypothetical protein
MPIELIKKGGKVDLTAYIPKGALPIGVDMGEFAISPATPFGEYQIEHTLGVIPNLILIYRDDARDDYYNGTVRACLKMNVHIYYDRDEDIYFPDTEIIRGFYDTNVAVQQVAGATPDVDTDTYFYVPKISNKVYVPADTYKWVAIAYGGRVE